MIRARGDAPNGVLDAVRSLAPLISARAGEMESERCLPPDLFEQLKSVGVFRMLTPKSHGGDEVGLLASMEVLEALARADGSTGWTTMIGAESPQLLSLLPRSTYDALYSAGPDVTLGGSFAPAGQAQVVEGGYRVSGRWPFASGCQRWDWLFANCSLVDGEQARVNELGEPVSRAMLVRPRQVEIEDTWRVLGLRATGSHHFTIRDVFVPEQHTFDIFGRPCVGGVARYPIIDFCFHITSVAIGIALAALDDVIGAAAARQRMSMRETLARTPLMQFRLGQAETSLRAARALLRSEARRLVRDSTNGVEPDFLALMARVYGNDAWVARVCTDVVDACHRMYGAAGIYESSPLQRRLRDIHSISQHAALNENAITRAGAALLGQPVSRWF